jgi:TetR/AcrR family transcriptional regulator, tetracycline repressor protein
MTETKLSRELIIATAVEILKEDGLDQVSLRRVATKLGIKAPSLYWYVSDKADLLGLVCEGMFRGVMMQLADCKTWQSWLRHFGVTLWRTQIEIPDLARLLMIARYPEEVFRKIDGDLQDQLSSLGVSRDQAQAMHSSVQSLATGWAGFSTGPNGEWLKQGMSIDQVFKQSLDALIVGYEALVKT